MVMSPEFPGPDKTKVEHAGQPGVPENVAEFGVADYDKTDLQQAADQHLEVPTDLGEGFQHMPLSPTEDARINALVEERYAQRLEAEPKPKKRWSLKTKLIAGAATVAAVIGIGAGAKALTGDKDDEGSKLPVGTTSAPATTGPSNEVSPTPTQTTTEAPTPSATETENPTETGMSAERIAVIDDMPYSEFAELDYAEQVQYDVSKVKLLSDEGYLYDFVDQQTVNNNSLANYNFIDNPTPETAGTNIALQNLYINQIIMAWKKANPGPEDGAGLKERGRGKVDKTMAKKLTSLYALPGTEDHDGMIETINNVDKKTGKQQDLYAGRIEDEDGSKDESGNTDVKAYYATEIMRPLYQGTVEINGKLTTLKLQDQLTHTAGGDKIITYAAIPINNSGDYVWPSVKTVNPSEYTK